MTVRTVSGPRRPFAVDTRVPGDKSLSHRALLLAGMARGASRVAGQGPGADVVATRRGLVALGVTVDGERVDSPGVDGWSAPRETVDCGNSGTTMRLLAGAASARPFPTILDGDASLRRRPMARLVAPLRAVGATISVGADGRPRVVAGGGRRPTGGDVRIGLASAQVRSAVELAALQATAATRVDSPPGFRDHTERWLEALGLGSWAGTTAFEVRPGTVPVLDVTVPGDPSSAAYLWAAAAVSGSRARARGVSLNPGRLGFLDVLRSMGVTVEATVTGEVLGDPVGDVEVVGGSPVATLVAGALAVRALDELPLVAVVAAVADGVTEVRDAAELRAKESDRIATTVAMVTALGGRCLATDDGFVVEGVPRLAGGVVDAAGDHRIAMAAAVAAAAATGPVTIRGAEAAAVSWPGFFERLEAAWSS